MTKKILLILIINLLANSLYAQAGKKTAKIAKEAAKEPVKEAPAVVEPAPVTPEKTPQAVAFDNKYNWDMYFRVNQTTVNSATAANGLKMENAFLVNRAIANRNVFMVPGNGQFKGQIYDFGFGVRHNWLFKSNWLFSGGSLADTSSNNFYYEQGLVSVAIGNTTSTIPYSSSYIYPYSKNTLKTGRISYAAEFFPWSKTNPVLAKLGLRAGLEIYGNGTKLQSDYPLSAATFTSIFNLLQSREVRSSEGFANMVLGLSYSYEINPKNQVDFGFDYFKSVASAGSYKMIATEVFPISTTLSFPVPATSTGSFVTELTGYRFNVGYKFQLFENMGIRLSYGYWDASHDVTSSKLKDLRTLSSMYTGVVSRNLVGYGATYSLTGFGPNPSSNDKRSQIGFEVVFRF